MALKDFFFKPKKDKNPDDRAAGGNQQNQYELFRGTNKDRTASPQTGCYFVCRESMTGVTEYRYYCGDRLLGTANAMVMPSFPVRIQGCGMMLDTEFDKTIFPGVTRELMDPDSGRLYGSVIWYGDGTHALNLPGDSLVVKSNAGAWRFLRQGRVIAELRKGPESGSRLILLPFDSVADDLALLMMCFPLIQIAQ